MTFSYDPVTGLRQFSLRVSSRPLENERLLLYIRKRLPKCQIQESKSSLKAVVKPERKLLYYSMLYAY